MAFPHNISCHPYETITNDGGGGKILRLLRCAPTVQRRIQEFHPTFHCVMYIPFDGRREKMLIDWILTEGREIAEPCRTSVSNIGNQKIHHENGYSVLMKVSANDKPVDAIYHITNCLFLRLNVHLRSPLSLHKTCYKFFAFPR